MSITDSQLAHFTRLVQQTEPFPLLEAAVCVGHVEDAELDTQELVQGVTNMTSNLKEAVEKAPPVYASAFLVSRVFYERCGFRGNVGTAYDPSQLYLHRVLETGLGDSLSLGIVWLVFAEAVGVSASGSMVSDYFVISAREDDGSRVVIDPLNGRLLDLPELQMMKTHQPYQGSTLDPERFLDETLVAATPRQIIGFLLERLESIYATRRQQDSRIAVLDRLIALQPKSWDAYRRRGVAHSQVNGTSAAIRDLTTYTNNASSSSHVSAALELLERLHKNG